MNICRINNETLYYLKQMIKEYVWKYVKKIDSNKKNIMLISSPRSGSTLLMEVIACNKGIRYIDQPFSIWSNPVYVTRYLPVKDYGVFISLNDEEKMKVNHYMQAILNGDMSIAAPWEIWSKYFDLHYDRLVIKELDTKPILGYFIKNFDLEIIYSTRNPIPTCLSVIRNKWGLNIDPFLNNEEFISEYLPDKKVDYARKIMKSNDLLKKHILNWTVQNIIPYRLLQNEKHNLLYLSYEELISYPNRSIKLLTSRLNLEDSDKMIIKLNSPSRSTKKGSEKSIKDNIVSNGITQKNIFLKRYRSKISEDREKELLEIVHEYGVNLYTAGKILPEIVNGIN